MRKLQHDKEAVKEKEDRRAKGDHYSRERLQKMKPPSFLNKKKEQKKQTLLSIEVSITPTKTGLVAIKEGDDVVEVATNFCKAYSLGKEMQTALTQQLETHVKNYYRQKMTKAILKKSMERQEKIDKTKQDIIDKVFTDAAGELDVIKESKGSLNEAPAQQV